MFDKLKKDLYFKKANIIFRNGILNKEIEPFNDDFYNELAKTYIFGLPVSIHIKYLKPNRPPGKCFERSLYMFLAQPSSILVRGNIKTLEYKYGKENSRHGWIEMDDYVYDPTSLYKYKKDLYYKIYEPTDITKTTKEDYIKENKEEYYKTKKTLEDYLPDGDNRIDLYSLIPILEEIVLLINDETFNKEIENYFKLIKYNKDTFEEEIEKIFQKKMDSKKRG